MKENSSISMAKLIMAVSLIVGFGIVIVLMGFLGKMKDGVLINEEIIIATDKTEYDLKEYTIKVAIKNNSSKTIVYQAPYFCADASLGLEKLVDNNWKTDSLPSAWCVAKNKMLNPDSTITITVELNHSEEYQKSGIYRISFKYFGKVDYSNKFTIKEKLDKKITIEKVGRVYVVGNELFTNLALEAEGDKTYCLIGSKFDELWNLQGKDVIVKGNIDKEYGCFIGKTISVTSFIIKEEVKNETADWKTYRNEEYGFEVMYPEDYFFEQGAYVSNEEYRKSWVQFADSKWKEQMVHNPSLIIDLIKTDLSVEEYLNETGDEGSIIDGTCLKEAIYCSVKNEKDIYISDNKIPALQFSSVAVSGSDNHVLIKDKGYIIDLRKHNSGIGSFPENVYDQILFSFKFIEKDETVNWKTYRNEEYGFEFEYPRVWTMDDWVAPALVSLGLNKEGYSRKPDTDQLNSVNFYLYESIESLDYKKIYPVSLKDYLDGYSALPDPVYVNVVSHKIGNMDGYMADAGLNQFGGGRYFFAELANKQIISFWLFNERTDQRIMNTILSTFKFIKEEDTEKIKLFYYNTNYDPEFDCLTSAVVPVEREISKTETPIQDAINLLIRGEITAEEKLSGFMSEFPFPDFKLLNADLEDGILTLSFTEISSFTNGGSCRIGILSAQIIKTAEQFNGVEKVIFSPIELFQS